MDATQRTERGFDRLVNFSDAVVAIAITLLVLPLTDLVSDPTASEGAFDVIRNNWSTVGAFLLTFAVTAMFWLIHHRVFEFIGDYDPVLAWLNMLWLLLIVMLPFASGLLEEQGFQKTNGLVYCWILAGLSASLGLISLWVRTHPELLAKHASPNSMGRARSWAFAAYLFVLGLISLAAPDLAQWGMLGLFVLGQLLRDR